MNQILQVKETQKEHKSSNAKDMIIFLIIFFIIFGLIIGAYALYQYIINHNETPSDIYEAPIITLAQTEDNQVIINVKSKIEISSITYKWNDEELQSIEITENTNIEEAINIPTGENTIYITVTDINGKETQKQESFVIEVSKPVIELSVIGNNIKITVTSEVDLSTITYNWNSEAEKKEDMLTYQNRKEFEKQLEIPIGNNTLKIVAVDVNGSKTEKIQEIKGITKATTTTTVKDGYWYFTVKGKENIKTVEFEFNNQKYLMNTDTFGKTKTVKYKVKLIEGKNYLTVTSTTESDGIDTTTWEQEYTLEN